MNKNEIKKIRKEIEDLMNDLNYELELSEDNRILISDSKKKEINSYLKKELSEEELNLFFEKKIQIHQKLDRDIKIEMIKLSEYNIKLIYHRKSDNSKEFRIFLSYKNKDKKLIRKRYINDSIRKIHNDEDKMKDFLYKIKKNQIDEYLKIS